MIAVDTNILVYAHREDSPHHRIAARALDQLAQSPWAIPWPCLHEFLSVVTRARVYVPSTPLAIAIDQVNAWLESPNLVLLSEADNYWSSLRDILTTGGILGSKIHDARIAAICLQHGVRELWSADRDFSRFPALRTINPLIEPDLHLS